MLRALAIGVLRLYQVTAGRVTAGHCRFHPTCSEYALQAVRSGGVVRGIFLASWRILRCGPWNRGGVDYPPHSARSHG